MLFSEGIITQSSYVGLQSSFLIFVPAPLVSSLPSHSSLAMTHHIIASSNPKISSHALCRAVFQLPVPKFQVIAFLHSSLVAPSALFPASAFLLPLSQIKNSYANTQQHNCNFFTLTKSHHFLPFSSRNSSDFY